MNGGICNSNYMAIKLSLFLLNTNLTYQEKPRVCLDNLNSESLDLSCGLYHADRGRSGLHLSFSDV